MNFSPCVLLSCDTNMLCYTYFNKTQSMLGHINLSIYSSISCFLPQLVCWKYYLWSQTPSSPPRVLFSAVSVRCPPYGSKETVLVKVTSDLLVSS